MGRFCVMLQPIDEPSTLLPALLALSGPKARLVSVEEWAPPFWACSEGGLRPLRGVAL